jgi:hypothetical protein
MEIVATQPFSDENPLLFQVPSPDTAQFTTSSVGFNFASGHEFLWQHRSFIGYFCTQS